MPFAAWQVEHWDPQMAKYDKIFKRTGFLTSTYLRRYWWFESLVTIYKLAMTVLVMFVSDSDQNKILFGMLGATAMMAVFAFYQPFRHRDILSINTVAQLVVLLVLFAAMFLLLNNGGSNFIAFALVFLTLAPLVAGVVLTVRLPEEALRGREAGDALSKDLSDAMMLKLTSSNISGKLGSSLGKMSSLMGSSQRLKGKRKKGRQSQEASGDDWSEQTDGEGNVYFHNASIGESAWERPVSTAANKAEPAASEWSEHADGEGRAYYLNVSTGETSWERPAVPAASKAVSPRPLRALRTAAHSVRVKLGSALAGSTAKPMASADAWTEHTDSDGRLYFVDASTGESSWERPASVAASETVSPGPLHAVRTAASSIRTKLGNSFTKRTTNPLGSANQVARGAENFSSDNPMHKGNRARAVTVTRSKAAESSV
jgi:hypothetical protein